MKLKQALDVFTALSALGATKLPAKTGYRVAKAINAFKPEVVAYEEMRNRLASELGTLTEDGKQYTFEGDSIEAFNSQHAALFDEVFEVTFPTIAPDDLGNAEIEPQYLAVLDGIFIKEASDVIPD